MAIFFPWYKSEVMTQKINLKMGRDAWIMLIVLSLVWGGSFFFAEVALRQIAPLTLVLARVGLAAVCLIAFTYLTGLRMPGDAKVWRAYFTMGLLNNCIPFSLIFWGQLTIASGLAAIFNATTPLFTVVLAHFLTRDEKLTPARFAGVICGVVGVAIMIGPDLLGTLGTDVIAQLAVLLGAISYGFAGIFGRRFARQSPVVTAAGQLSASSIILLPVVLFMEFSSPHSIALDVTTIAAVVALALLSTAMAYVLYFRILKVAGATNLLLVTFLIPISAVALGVMVLDEQIEPPHIVGMAFIALGLIAIDGRLLAWIKK